MPAHGAQGCNVVATLKGRIYLTAARRDFITKGNEVVAIVAIAVYRVLLHGGGKRTTVATIEGNTVIVCQSINTKSCSRSTMICKSA